MLLFPGDHHHIPCQRLLPQPFCQWNIPGVILNSGNTRWMDGWTYPDAANYSTLTWACSISMSKEGEVICPGRCHIAGDRVSHQHGYMEKRLSLPGLSHDITFLSFCFAPLPVSPGLVRAELVKVSLTPCTLCKQSV